MMPEKEYIERGALLAKLKQQYGDELGWWATVNMSDVGMMIEDMPAADVVPVVRCKDCIRGFTKFIKNEKVIECQLFNYDDSRQFKDLMDYCSHGVKNEGENKNENS